MNTSETTNLSTLIQRVEGLSEAANDMLAAVREREADLGGGNSEAYAALNARVTELSESVDAIRETASGGGLDEAAISQAVAALEKSYETHAATFAANDEKITALSEDMGGKLNKADYNGYPSKSKYINVPWAPTLDDNRAMAYTPPSDGMIYFFAIGTTTTSHMHISNGVYTQSQPIVYTNRHHGLLYPASAGEEATIGGYGLTSQAVRFFPAKKVS